MALLWDLERIRETISLTTSYASVIAVVHDVRVNGKRGQRLFVHSLLPVSATATGRLPP